MYYYPFGMEMEGPWELSVGVPENKYLFNGIERESDFGLDWDMANFRSYDPTIGRWCQIDPFAEIAYELTPYRFGFNNPVLFSDPLGLFETRRDARRHRRKTKGMSIFKGDIVRKQKDGSYAIENRAYGSPNTSTSEVTLDDGTTSVMTSLLVTPTDIMSTRLEGDGGIKDFVHTLRDGSEINGGPSISTGAPPLPGMAPVKTFQVVKGLKALPKLDATGKVHGVLPKLKDISKYSKADLKILLKELRQSVQQRIKVTVQKGRDKGHGQRQGAEQDLIKAIEKHLGG